MPFSSDYIRTIVYGDINVAETWSVGLSVRTSLATGSWTFDNLTAIQTNLQTFWNTWWTTVKASNVSQVRKLGQKVYAYPQSGGKAYLVADLPDATPTAGTQASGLPMYVSCVASLRTLHAGKSGRGRMYVPATGANVTAGQFSSTLNSSFATTTKALIDSINAVDWTGSGVTGKRVCVVSHVASSFFDVTSIQVDSKPDTQHRRSDKFAPSSNAVALVA